MLILPVRGKPNSYSRMSTIQLPTTLKLLKLNKLSLTQSVSMACIKCQGIIDLPLRFFNPPLRIGRQDYSDSGRCVEEWQSSTPELNITYEHWSSALDLSNSVGSGCVGCSLILESLLEFSASDHEYPRDTSFEQLQKQALDELLSAPPSLTILMSVNTAFNSMTIANFYEHRFLNYIPNEMIRHLEVSCSAATVTGELEIFVTRGDLLLVQW